MQRYSPFFKQHFTNKQLIIFLNEILESDLTWEEPLASQVISSDSSIVERLFKKQYNKFMVYTELVNS